MCKYCKYFKESSLHDTGICTYFEKVNKTNKVVPTDIYRKGCRKFYCNRTIDLFEMVKSFPIDMGRLN